MNVWTEPEKTIIEQLYASTDINQLAVMLPGRSKPAIRGYAQRLGIQKAESKTTDVYLYQDGGMAFLMPYAFQGHEPAVNDRILADRPYSIVERIWHQGQLRVLVVPAER
jgi:hypothetical protein